MPPPASGRLPKPLEHPREPATAPADSNDSLPLYGEELKKCVTRPLLRTSPRRLRAAAMSFGGWAVPTASASCCLAIGTPPRASHGARRLEVSCLRVRRRAQKVCHTAPTQDFTPPPEGCGHELWRLGRAHSLSQLLPSHRNTPESQPRRPPTQSPHTASCCLAIGMGTPLRASRGARRIEFSHKPKAARVFRKPLHPSRESSRGLWRCDCSV